MYQVTLNSRDGGVEEARSHLRLQQRGIICAQNIQNCRGYSELQRQENITTQAQGKQTFHIDIGDFGVISYCVIWYIFCFRITI